MGPPGVSRLGSLDYWFGSLQVDRCEGGPLMYREVSVTEIREVLRAWLSGRGLRVVAAQAGVDRKTARRFVFNNASPNLSGATISGTRARITVPVCPATDVRLTGTVVAPTAEPPEIWSTVHFTADKPFKLVPANRQAVVCFDRTHCAHGTGFTALPPATQLFSQHGIPLGSDGLDGLFPPATSVDVIFYVTAVFTAETTHP
jgi:hypothetical protein